MAKWRARLRRLSPREADSTEPHEPNTAYVIRGGPRPGDSRAHSVRLFGVDFTYHLQIRVEGAVPHRTQCYSARGTHPHRGPSPLAPSRSGVSCHLGRLARLVCTGPVLCAAVAPRRVSEQYEHSVPDAAHAGTAAPLCHRRPDPPPPSSRPRLTSQPNQLVS